MKKLSLEKVKQTNNVILSLSLTKGCKLSIKNLRTGHFDQLNFIEFQYTQPNLVIFWKFRCKTLKYVILKEIEGGGPRDIWPFSMVSFFTLNDSIVYIDWYILDKTLQNWLFTVFKYYKIQSCLENICYYLGMCTYMVNSWLPWQQQWGFEIP